MRKYIVKYFALGYKFGMLRASTIIMPLFVISSVLTLIFKYNIYSLSSWTLTAIAMYFGFVYFKYNPIKWHELDTFQKYQYGKVKPLTTTQRKEWQEISNTLDL